MTDSSVTVVGVFQSPAEAQQAIRRLTEEGYAADQISLIAPHPEEPLEESATESRVKEDAAIGATAGLGAGALWGIAIAVGLLPAIGPAIAGGALIGIVATAAATAAAGGLVGALIGLGVPEKEAEFYHGEFEQGRTVVTVQCEPEASLRVQEIFGEFNAYDFQSQQSEFAADPNAPDFYEAVVANREPTTLDQQMDLTPLGQHAEFMVDMAETRREAIDLEQELSLPVAQEIPDDLDDNASTEH